MDCLYNLFPEFLRNDQFSFWNHEFTVITCQVSCRFFLWDIFEHWWIFVFRKLCAVFYRRLCAGWRIELSRLDECFDHTTFIFNGTRVYFGLHSARRVVRPYSRNDSNRLEVCFDHVWGMCPVYLRYISMILDIISKSLSRHCWVPASRKQKLSVHKYQK